MPASPTPARGSKPASSPRRGRGRLDRAAILERAAGLADRDGLDALTLTALAGEPGIRPPALYNHVASLEELRRALAVRRTGAVVALGEAYRAHAHAHPGLYAAIMAAGSSATPELDAARMALMDTVGVVLRGFGLAGAGCWPTSAWGWEVPGREPSQTSGKRCHLFRIASLSSAELPGAAADFDENGPVPW